MKYVVWAVLGFFSGTMWSQMDFDKREQRERVEIGSQAYAILHNCERRGFTNGEPFYQCDNGLLTEHEMYQNGLKGN